jgi:tetratricopeptide (TPR) repeat protein
MHREPQIWLDRNLFVGESLFEDSIFEKVRKSKLFVAILSPAFLKSDWCRSELQYFIESNKETDSFALYNHQRIFKVFKTPVSKEELPELLDQFQGFEFFQPDYEKYPVTINPNRSETDKEKFFFRVSRLASEIAESLNEIDLQATSGSTSDVSYREWNDKHYWSLHDAARYEEAESYCRRIIEFDPLNLGARAYLGHLLDKHFNRFDEAEKVFLEGIKINQSDPTLYFFLGDLLVKQDRYEEAEKNYRKTLELVSFSDEAKVLIKLNALLEKQGKYREAEESYRKTFKIAEPKDKAAILIGLGKLLNTHFKKHDEAFSIFQEAIAIEPENSGNLNDIAWSLYASNTKLFEAERFIKQALSLAPEDINSLHTLASILVRLDKWDEAKPKIVLWVQRVHVTDLKNSWHYYQPMFYDAIKNKHTRELLDILQLRNDDIVWSLLRAVLRAIDNGLKTFDELPIKLHNAGRKLMNQLISRHKNPRFPVLPATGNWLEPES